jgi:porphobilinogen synthase
MADVALDPYTSHGHDGIVIDGTIDNDVTVEMLVEQALVLAQAGADAVAPSDMMDGRVLQIRQELEAAGLKDVLIISYAAKYVSAFYGPFRDAVGSNVSNVYLDKSSYQMDYRNAKEAVKEVVIDAEEGADIILVKPALSYLDIISKVSEYTDLPVFAYQVSGEYAALKFAAQNGALNFEKVMIETLASIKRAGASCILTYYATEMAELLSKDK